MFIRGPHLQSRGMMLEPACVAQDGLVQTFWEPPFSQGNRSDCLDNWHRRQELERELGVRAHLPVIAEIRAYVNQPCVDCVVGGLLILKPLE